MNSRERVLCALSHKQPDHVPVELGSTWNSTLTLTAHYALSDHYGGGYIKYRIMRWVDTLVFPDTDLLDCLSVDCRSIYNRTGTERTMADMYNRLGLISTPDGRLALCDKDGRELQVKPSNSEEFQEKDPVLGGSLEAQAIEAIFPATPDAEFSDMTQDLGANAKRLRQETDYALIQSNFIAMPVTQMQQALGYEGWYVNLMMSEKELIYATEKYLDMRFAEYEVYFKTVGPYIDLTECVGDDMADQRGPTFSLDQYRRIFKPMHRRLIEFVKKYTSAKIMFHICGAAAAYFPDLIDIGVEVINPIQVSAQGMDPVRLKREYGKDITFFGGIDTQAILPFGTPEQVSEHVRRTIDILGKDGGYICAPSHDIQRDVPIENIIAMYEAIKDTF